MDIQGKVAIVTGGGTGIGRAISEALAGAGMKVVVTARREAPIQETAHAIVEQGGQALAVPCDVTDAEQVRRMVQQTLNAYGRIDVLYNNAGSFITLGGLWEVDPEDWWHDATVNLRGPMLCSHAVLPTMMAQNEGVIINMDGGGSTSPLMGGSAYGSSKAALLRFTETLAKELAHAGSNVMVFALGPGFVRTEMTVYQAESELGRKWLPMVKEALEAGRTTPPTACAQATFDLLSIARPELSGRIFGAGNNFEKIGGEAEQIAREDRMVLRAR